MKRLFDRRWYLEQYPEALEYPKGPFRHYVDVGWKKGYDPSPYFSTDMYIKERPDVLQSGMCPLIHYYRYGKREGSSIYASVPVYEGNYRKRPLMFIPRLFNRVLWHRQIKKNRNKKILVILHLFYRDAFKEIRYYLDNLSCYSYDLMVTYSKDADYGDVLNTIKKYRNDTVFLPVKNRGYDILPFLIALKHADLDKYDIVYKIHTKKTTHFAGYVYGSFFKNRDWFLRMFDGILGPKNVHKTIAALCEEPDTGLCCNEKLIVHDNEPKHSLALKRMEDTGLKINPDYRYVAGTCFAVRKEIAELYRNINIDNMLFSDSSYRGYFSVAHAMERYLGFLVTDNGYKMRGNSVSWYQENKWKKLESKLEQVAGSRLLDEVPVCFSEEFALRCLEYSSIRSWEFEQIKTGDLISVQPTDLKAYHLKELEPYRYLKTGDREAYIRYCENGRRSDFLNLSEEEFHAVIREVACDRFDELIKDMEQNGYDRTRPIIIEKATNRILDGTHRACWLLYKYGKDTQIDVLTLDIIHYDLFSAKPFSSRLTENRMTYSG